MRADAEKKIRFRMPLLLGAAALLLQCRVAATRVRLVAQESRKTHEPVGPIPVAGPLAAPKSLSHVGVPVEATRAAVPADNPQNREKIALGEELFFDGRLAVDSTVAGSACHDPARAFTDGRLVPVGVKGCEGQRHAPAIRNSLYNVAQFCDGRAKTLDDQASVAIINPCEMGQPHVDAAVVEIAESSEYQQVDRTAIQSDMSVLGRFSGYEERGGHGVVQTPVAAQGPSYGPVLLRWFAGDARDVLDHYNNGDGIRDPWLDQDMQLLALSDTEIDDLVAFLASLTNSRFKEQGIRKLDLQRARFRTERPPRDTPRAFGLKSVEPKPLRIWAALPAATNSK